MNIKNIIILLLCISSISKGNPVQPTPTMPNKNETLLYNIDSDLEIEKARKEWKETPEEKAVDFAIEISKKHNCSYRPISDSEECKDLIEAIRILVRFSESTPQSKKYNDLREQRKKNL